jgi:phospholipid transport system substrate-binding protein
MKSLKDRRPHVLPCYLHGSLFATFTLLVIAMLWSQPARAADDPAAVIRSTVDQAFDVLRDQDLKKPERRKERIAKLRVIADRVFDWDTMAQSSLGVAYRSITDDQRKQFVTLFRDIIADDYKDDIDRFIGDERVLVQGAENREDQRVVKTILVTHSRDRVRVDYFMEERSGRWQIVDFSVEGVSLVNHYRTSFANFLANHTFGNLLDRLKARHSN